MSSPTLSFGYGAILDRDRWCAWCRGRQARPDAMSPVESAWLPDYELAFTHRGGDLVRYGCVRRQSFAILDQHTHVRENIESPVLVKASS